MLVWGRGALVNKAAVSSRARPHPIGTNACFSDRHLFATTFVKQDRPGFPGPFGVEPAGIEPATSCLQRRSSDRALVSPPVALTLHVFARILAEIGRADHEDLEALRPGLVASPRTGWDAHHVPLLDLDDLVVELHPPAPTHDHVHLLLLLVGVAVREAIVGRDALIAEAALLELERLAREAELQVRHAVEVGPEILQILLEVPERERHGCDPIARSRRRRVLA